MKIYHINLAYCQLKHARILLWLLYPQLSMKRVYETASVSILVDQ